MPSPRTFSNDVTTDPGIIKVQRFTSSSVDSRFLLNKKFSYDLETRPVLQHLNKEGQDGVLDVT